MLKAPDYNGSTFYNFGIAQTVKVIFRQWKLSLEFSVMIFPWTEKIYSTVLLPGAGIINSQSSPGAWEEITKQPGLS